MILYVNEDDSRSVAGMTVTKEKEGGTLGTFPSCIPLKPRLITTDAGTESGRTFPCIFFQNPTALSSHFPRIPFRIPQAFLKTFYYFSFHDQNASYRASL